MALPTALKEQAERVDNLYKNTGEEEQQKPTLEAENNETPQQQPEAASQGDIDYKAKYQTLEGKYKAEVPKLHDQIKQLNAQIQQLSATPRNDDRVSQLEAQIRDLQTANSKLEQAQVNTSESATQLSQHLTDEYGEDFAQAVADQAKAIANAENNQLRQQLEQLRNEFSQTQQTVNQTTEQNAITTLKSTLSAKGIDFNQVDGDPLFHDWLSQEDPRSGMTLHQLMHSSFQQGDIQRTANFYIEYNASQPRSNRNLNDYADPISNVGQADNGVPQQVADPNAFTKLANQLRNKEITRQEYEQKERELFRVFNRR